MPAAIGSGANALVVRAALAGLYICVLSQHIRSEVYEVLQRPDFGATHAEIDAKLDPLWQRARFLRPVPSDDPRLLSVVKGDRKDLPVFATGLAIPPDPDLGPLPNKFLVSNNTTHFTPGWKPFGLHFVTGPQFWRLLQQGAGARIV